MRGGSRRSSHRGPKGLLGAAPAAAASRRFARANGLSTRADGLLAGVAFSLCAAVALVPSSTAAADGEADRAPCAVEVVDRQDGQPVPLVELRTTNQIRWVTDNAGVIALDAAELMGQPTWFDVIGHGYEAARDGFGYRGVRLTPQWGATLRVELNRTCIARRLGRLTGSGLLAESVKLGRAQPPAESGVVGCDSVQNAVYRGRLFWIWGDTTLADYPLGIFNASAATTPPRPITSFELPLKIAYDYFTDDRGRPRGVAAIPGEGPTWLSAVASLPDRTGAERLVATSVKIKPPLEPYELGLCAWNDEKRCFERLRVVWTRSDESPKPPPAPDGHAAHHTDARGRRWVLFGNPLPVVRCPATFEAWQDPATWEVLKPQASLASADGGRVRPHSGSIAWSAYRKRWVSVFMEALGKPSAFGELWYAEADAPEGPWGPAVKILSHENYTFYNPRVHGEWLDERTPFLLFEATYTQQFADRPVPTPRYDYNQILYRLDFDEPRLEAPRSPAAAREAD